jgi:hypothetical protein
MQEVNVRYPVTDLKAQRGGRGIALLFLHLSTRRWVVSTMPWLLYPQERLRRENVECQ